MIALVDIGGGLYRLMGVVFGLAEYIRCSITVGELSATFNVDRIVHIHTKLFTEGWFHMLLVEISGFIVCVKTSQYSVTFVILWKFKSEQYIFISFSPNLIFNISM